MNGPSISFEDLFGGSPDNVSVEQLETLLDEVVSNAPPQNGNAKRQLVRVVENGIVRWMTADEAEAHVQSLEAGQDESLKRSIQFALRGDSRVLAMEMQVLLTLARGTLNNYRDNSLIPEAEVQRTEPQLTRISRSLIYTLGELREVEVRIEDTRKKNPIMDEFEAKMAELLDMQRGGRTSEALPLAKELAGMKPRYVRISKIVHSETNSGYQFRLDIQHKKKSVLSWHRYLAAQREGVLQEESQEIRKKIDNLKAVLQRAVEAKIETYKTQLSQRETQFDDNQKELSAVKQEIAYLNHKEKEASGVIGQMQDKLGIAPKVDPQEEQPPESPPPAQETPVPEPEEEKKKRVRMAIMSQRR